MSRFISKLSRQAYLIKRKLAKDFEVHNKIEISRSAVANNYRLLEKVSGLDVIPVLKGNAYGHGIGKYAQILAPLKPKYLAVDGYFEAMKIWSITGYKTLIMGAVAPSNFKNAPHKNTAYFIQDTAVVKAMGETGRPFVMHLEIDTGMSRYGVSETELKPVLEEIKKYPQLVLEGVCTHFAEADMPDSNFLNVQIEKFEKALAKVKSEGFSPTIIHAANSAGTVRVKSKHLTAVRPGIAMHGINPVNDPHFKKVYKSQMPTMRITSTITKTRMLDKGDTVSYGRTFTADRKTRIGVIPMGYYEAVPRQLSGVGVVGFKDQYLPIVGRVCMNHTILDLTESDAQVGDEVIIIDRDSKKPNSFMGWYRDHQLYPHQMMANIDSTIKRIIVD